MTSVEKRFAILLLSALLCALMSCGGAQKKGGGYTSNKSGGARTSKRENDKKGKGSRIENQARRETLKRKGEWNLTSDKVEDVASLVREAAQIYKVPKDLIFGIIWVESRFNPKAVSPVGAKGLMQLMPKTAVYLADCIDWNGKKKLL